MTDLYLGRTLVQEDRHQLQDQINKLAQSINNVQGVLQDAEPLHLPMLRKILSRLEHKKFELTMCLTLGIFITNTPWEI